MDNVQNCDSYALRYDFDTLAGCLRPGYTICKLFICVCMCACVYEIRFLAFTLIAQINNLGSQVTSVRKKC
jgi:hypothetical protein